MSALSFLAQITVEPEATSYVDLVLRAITVATPYLVLALAIFTIDLVERRLRSDAVVEAFRAAHFWIYLGYHWLAGSIVLLGLHQLIPQGWICALLAAGISTQILSRIDLKFNGRAVLPLSRHFRVLRARTEEELARRREDELVELQTRLAVLGADTLQREWTSLMVRRVGVEKAMAQLGRLNTVASDNNVAYRAALASDLVIAGPDHVSSKIRDWEITAGVRA